MQQALSGRRGQAAQNDEPILAAAREVFIADADAPISAVASRGDVTPDDLPFILEMVAAIRPGVFGDDEWTAELRQRYLSLCLDGLRRDEDPLSGAPPSDAELGRRWQRRPTSG